MIIIGKINKKSQVSVEFVSVVGFTMLILIPLIIAYYQNTSESTFRIRGEQVYKVMNEIVDNAEVVYYLGPPSKVTLKAYIPRGIDSIVINGKEIVFRLKFEGKISELSVVSKVNLSGSIDSSPGIHNIVIQAREGYVSISG